MRMVDYSGGALGMNGDTTIEPESGTVVVVLRAWIRRRRRGRRTSLGAGLMAKAAGSVTP
jgi:hypothetical protein